MLTVLFYRNGQLYEEMWNKAIDAQPSIIRYNLHALCDTFQQFFLCVAFFAVSQVTTNGVKAHRSSLLLLSQMRRGRTDTTMRGRINI